MKHSKSCRSAREFFDLLLANKKAVITCSMILLLLILINSIGYKIAAAMYGCDFTLSDVLLLLTKPTLFGIVIVPVLLFLIAILLKYDFNPTGIIRRKSRQGLWLKQVGNLVAFSALAAAYLTVCCAAVSLFVANSICNWDKENSFFFRDLLAKAASDKFSSIVPKPMTVPPSALEILGMFFLFSFFSITAIGMIVLLIKWIFGSHVLGFCIIITIALLDWFDVPVLYAYSSILYVQWAKDVPVICNMIYPVVWIAVLTAIGWLFAKRKDFLGAQQK